MTAAAANLVNLERVSKSYGVRPLLHEVSLGVGEGERIGVVGRNGDGKTTLLDLLAGCAEPDGGRVSRTRGLRLGYLRQRDDQPVLDLCIERGIPYVPYFPLGSAGMPGTVKVTDDPAVKSVAQRLGVTPSQVGLAWVLAQGPNVLLIPGTSSVAHLEENLAAAAVVLDEQTLATAWGEGRAMSLDEAVTLALAVPE